MSENKNKCLNGTDELGAFWQADRWIPDLKPKHLYSGALEGWRVQVPGTTTLKISRPEKKGNQRLISSDHKALFSGGSRLGLDIICQVVKFVLMCWCDLFRKQVQSIPTGISMLSAISRMYCIENDRPFMV